MKGAATFSDRGVMARGAQRCSSARIAACPDGLVAVPVDRSGHTSMMRVHLTSAMALVVHDLEKTAAPVPLVEESDWQDHPGAESAMLRSSDGTGMGVWIDTGASEAAQNAMLADQVQEWVVELAESRVTNWPQCPEHPHNHPMAAVAYGDIAAWVCPIRNAR